MLTILHVGENGEENLVECSSFRRERRGDGLFQFLAYGEMPNNGDYLATWCGDMRNGSLHSQTIYVMNSKGATVATYSFDAPTFEPESVASDLAEDEKFAA